MPPSAGSSPPVTLVTATGASSACGPSKHPRDRSCICTLRSCHCMTRTGKALRGTARQVLPLSLFPSQSIGMSLGIPSPGTVRTLAPGLQERWSGEAGKDPGGLQHPLSPFLIRKVIYTRKRACPGHTAGDRKRQEGVKAPTSRCSSLSRVARFAGGRGGGDCRAPALCPAPVWLCGRGDWLRAEEAGSSVTGPGWCSGKEGDAGRQHQSTSSALWEMHAIPNCNPRSPHSGEL